MEQLRYGNLLFFLQDSSPLQFMLCCYFRLTFSFSTFSRYFIPESENKKLEMLANSLAQSRYQITKTCGLFVRHKTLLIPPSLLRKNGIEFARVSVYFLLFFVSSKILILKLTNSKPLLKRSFNTLVNLLFHWLAPTIKVLTLVSISRKQ